MRHAQRRSLSPEPIDYFLHPLREFVHIEASAGMVLIASALVALIWANSPWSGAYEDLWHTELGFVFGSFELSKDLEHWINDGLMAVFFFLIGLEVKREVMLGELSNPKQIAVPLVAAVGGMVLPALIYAGFNFGDEGSSGWGVPMATDIAFALGALALLGSKVPLGLKSFLVAVAIADDIGAVLVIALFYTEKVDFVALILGTGLLGGALVLNRAGVRSSLPYVLTGAVAWLAFLESGVHATVAGVLMAFTIPARTRIYESQFLEAGRAILDDYQAVGESKDGTRVRQEQQAALQELETAVGHAWMPLQKIEHMLHPWVAFGIVPAFALANAGVSLGDNLLSDLTNSVSLGIIFGLVVGKQIGITLGAWIAVKIGVGTMPGGVTWPQIYGVAWLGGIGFTMSIFISTLSFGGGELLAVSKVGVLAASLISGVVGLLIIRKFSEESSSRGN